MSAAEVKKRLYVGGLAKDVTENELKQRFEFFVTVSSISVKSQTDSEGNHIKTFAHLGVQGTEADIKKCYNAYQNAKWRGSVMKLEDAKESFLDRLAVERQEEKNKLLDPDHGKSKKKKVEEWKPPEMDKLSVAPVPGTPVPGKKDWVVGKYGRVLPVLNVKKSHVTKAVKHDPSKFCHASKVFKEGDTDLSKVNSDALTWEIDEPDSEITKKRKGQFPPDPRPKKTKPFPVELLKPTVKEKFSSRSFTKENSSNKSFVKEKLAKNHGHNENVDDDNGALRGGDGDYSEANFTTDDGLEIVRVGGSMQKNDNPKVRSRFDSDYESDGDDNGTKSSNMKNNETNSPSNKSSKKTDNKKDSCAKKSKLISSNEMESESATEILEFKGIGSLITKPVDISPNKDDSMKNKASVHTEKIVCNGNMNTDSNLEENNNEVVPSSKKKRKRKSHEGEISPLKKVKKPVTEENMSFKPNQISTIQKNVSQYADLFLSEFVAKAPKNHHQSSQKQDPYDSDLDSNNFELVARKLAKKAGVQTAKENKKNQKKGDLSTRVNNFAKNGALSGSKTNKGNKDGVTSLMLSLAEGYSADRNTETSNTWSKQDKRDNIKGLHDKEPIPQKKDLMKSPSENGNVFSSKRTTFDSDDDDGNSEVQSTSKIVSKTTHSRNEKDISSFKKTVVTSHEVDDSSDEEEEVEKKNDQNVVEDSSSDEDDVEKNKEGVEDSSNESEIENKKGEDEAEDSSSDEVENSKAKDVAKDISSDESEVENSKAKVVVEDSSSDDDEVENSKAKDVVEDSSSDDDEVENSKAKDVVEDSSSDDDEVENSKAKDVVEDSSSDESEVEISKAKDVVEDSSSDESEVENSKAKDVVEDSSSDESEVENSKAKDVAKDSSISSRSSSSITTSSSSDKVEDSSSSDEVEDSSSSSSDEVEDSSSDESEVENSKAKDVAKGSSSSISSSSLSSSSITTTSSSSDKIEDSSSNGVVEDSSSCSDEVEDSSSSSDEAESRKGKDVVEDSSSDDESEDDSGDANNVKGKLAVPSKDLKDKASSKHKVLNSSSSSSDEEEAKDDTAEDQEISLAEEKKRNLQVLENVVGKNKVDKLTAKLKRDNVQIMDMNQLRFDPTKFKSQQTRQKEPMTKIKASPEKSEKIKEDIKVELPTPKKTPVKDKTPKDTKMEIQTPNKMPVKDITPKLAKKLKKESLVDSTPKSEVTMSDSLMTMLKTETQSGEKVNEKRNDSFSLLNMFDEQKDEYEEEAMETDFQSPVKPLSGLLSLPKLKDNKDNAVNNKVVSKDKDNNEEETVNAKKKDSKDKDMMKDAVTNKDKKTNVKKSRAASEKVLKDAGRVDVRFSKAKWEERNSQIRQDILKICRNRISYAVRKKKIEEEQEKEKTVRKFGSWKKK